MSKSVKTIPVVKNTTGKNQAAKNEIQVITEENLNFSVIKGSKKKDVKNELENYLRSQFNALYLTNNVDTFQLKVNDVIKEFLSITEDKITAASYDLNAIIQEVCFTLATDYKNNGEKRIPCIKANSDNVAILMTCKTEKFEFFYGKNVRSLETIKKSKQARAAKKTKELEEKKAHEEAAKNEVTSAGVVVDTPENATTCIMLLLAKYGNKLDIAAIKAAIETIENASVKNLKNCKIA